MLSSLHIENIAVIKRLDVDFSMGFSALTGETGAGKSIIIDSINMLMGGKVSRDIIRSGEHTAVVSGVFSNISRAFADKLSELGFECGEDGAILLQKTLSDDGKTQVKLNGRTVTTAIQKELSASLINICGQNESQKFLQKQSHLTLLDKFAHTEAELNEYEAVYSKYCELRDKLSGLESGDKEKNRLIEIYRFQVAEIDALKLKSGEEEVLEDACKKLRSIEKITKQTSFAYRILHSSDKSASVTYLLDRASASLSQITDVIPEAAELSERLKNYRYEIEDIAETVRDYGEDGLSDGDPTAKLNRLEGRLDAIAKLKRKYGSTIDEILSFRNETAEKLDELEQSDDKIAEIKTALIDTEVLLRKHADALTNKRRSAADSITERISDVLEFLDMPKVRFDISIMQTDFTSRGTDEVEFMVSTNPGEPLKPMVKIASGGELSRIMLAMMNVLADREGIGTMIFDEIDTGVSGRTSRKIGIKLKEISKNMQVICVTHSAQIASLADNHFYISKAEEEGRSVTELTLLDEASRVEEISRILGGINVTETQREAAREMIREGRMYL